MLYSLKLLAKVNSLDDDNKGMFKKLAVNKGPVKRRHQLIVSTA